MRRNKSVAPDESCELFTIFEKCLYPRLLKMMRARSSIISIRGGWVDVGRDGGDLGYALSLAHAALT
jgi:hypothetical protein